MCYLHKFIYYLFQTGKVVSSENDNASNRAAECIAERIEVFKSAFGETEEQLNQEKYVFTKIDIIVISNVLGLKKTENMVRRLFQTKI